MSLKVNEQGFNVSCDLCDRLAEIAKRGQECRLTYLNQEVELARIQGQIVAIYSVEGTDWCRLNNGSRVRLDRIEMIEQEER